MKAKLLSSFIFLFFLSCSPGQSSEFPDGIDQVKIISVSTLPHKNGLHVTVKVRNISGKPMTYVMAQIAMCDKNQNILQSGLAISKKPIGIDSSVVVDRFFADPPAGASFSCQIEEVKF